MYLAISNIISLWKRVGTVILNKLEFPVPKNVLCQVCLKLAEWFWRRRFLNLVNDFPLCCYYLPLENIEWPFIWTILNPHHSRMFCAKFGLNFPPRFSRRGFLNFVNVFSLFRYHLPLKKGLDLHWNQFVSSSKGCFVSKFGWNWSSGSGEDF